MKKLSYKFILSILTLAITLTLTLIPASAQTSSSNSRTIKIMTADGLKEKTFTENEPISVITKDGIEKRHLNQIYFINVDGHIVPIITTYDSLLILSILSRKNSKKLSLFPF